MYDFGIRQARTGYRVQYRAGITNCPGCGQSHWHVGRLTAECAFCSTALPLIAGAAFGAGLVRTRGPIASRTGAAAVAPIAA